MKKYALKNGSTTSDIEIQPRPTKVPSYTILRSTVISQKGLGNNTANNEA